MEAPPFLWPEEVAGSLEPDFSLAPSAAIGRKAPHGGLGAARHAALAPLALSGCGCGFFAQQTVPDYADEGMAGAMTTYFLQQGAAVAVFADILAHLRQPPGSVYVEIGCGFGFGLDIGTHAMGWRCRGMDPAKLAELGRTLLGVDITRAYFDPHTVADASCDIVMATETVLEHLPDPVGFLREVRRGLKPDGSSFSPPPMSPRYAGHRQGRAERHALDRSAFDPAQPDEPRHGPGQRRLPPYPHRKQRLEF